MFQTAKRHRTHCNLQAAAAPLTVHLHSRLLQTILWRTDGSSATYWKWWNGQM